MDHFNRVKIKYAPLEITNLQLLQLIRYFTWCDTDEISHRRNVKYVLPML